MNKRIQESISFSHYQLDSYYLRVEIVQNWCFVNIFSRNNSIVSNRKCGVGGFFRLLLHIYLFVVIGFASVQRVLFHMTNFDLAYGICVHNKFSTSHWVNAKVKVLSEKKRGDFADLNWPECVYKESPKTKRQTPWNYHHNRNVINSFSIRK